MFKNIIKTIGLVTVIGISLNASIFETASCEVAKSKIVPLSTEIKTVEETKDYNKRVIAYRNWRTNHIVKNFKSIRNDGSRINLPKLILLETNDLATDKYNKTVTEYNKKFMEIESISSCIITYRKTFKTSNKLMKKFFFENTSEKVAFCNRFGKDLDYFKNNQQIIYNPIINGENVPNEELDKRNFSYPIKAVKNAKI